MKKIFTVIFIIVIIVIFILGLQTFRLTSNLSLNNINMDKSSAKYNGWLHTSGSNLLNEKDEQIQLKGLSSHGIAWYSDVLTYENLKNLKETWGINVFRIAMYTDPNSNGYIANPTENKEKVYQIANWAIDLDMYVIIDWHILNDNNPQTYKEQAKEFFNEVSSKYSNTPNVIYEICNEPNENYVTWDNNIKPYAEELIPIIRNNSPKSLIIVGTPDWCKKLSKAADNPLNFENVIYSCHFYSGSHSSELREQIDYCLSKDIPIFVSECGLTDATGNGELYLDEFKTWINYLNEKNISWIYWSFSYKDESSAILSPDYKKVLTKNITISSENSIDNTIENNATDVENISTNFNDYLSESGKFIKELLND